MQPRRDRTPFIGREPERTVLLEALDRGTALLTVSGPSGIGKTRLVRQVLGEVRARDRMTDAYFCDLTSAREVRDVEAAVCRTLGLADKHGAALGRAIANRGAVLLVMDNLDAVARRVGGLLGSWIDVAPELQIIATSILPLQIEGEVHFDLGPMELGDAIDLYLERARRAWAGRIFTERDASSVKALVGRLDRIPLAIELAAARVRVLPPQALLARFDERFEFLHAAPDSETPTRHASLLGALQMTWDLLAPGEQLTLARASVFAGGFTLEAAQAVIGVDVPSLLDLLDGLRSKALLQIEETEPPRFQLYESVRDFAALELSRSGLFEETLLRHASFFARHGELHAGGLEGPDEKEASSWLQGERENLVAVLQRGLEIEPTLAARAGLAIAALLQVEGTSSPAALHHLETTLTAARRSEDPKLLGKALGYLAAAQFFERKRDCRALLEEGLALAREHGDRPLLAELLVHSASLAWLEWDHERARHNLEESVPISREEGLPLLEARGLLGLCSMDFEAGRFDEVDRLYEEVSTIAQRHRLLRFERLAQVWISMAWMSQGRFREAGEVLTAALRNSRAAGDRRVESRTLTNLCAVALCIGDLEEAEARAMEAHRIYRELGDRSGEGLSIANLGNAALGRGDLAKAEELLLESVGILSELGYRVLHASVLGFLALAEARRGRPEQARRTLEEARRYFNEIAERRYLGALEVLEGSIELAEARASALGPIEVQEVLQRVRGRLERVDRASIKLSTMFEALRLVRDDLREFEETHRDLTASPLARALRVGPGASWYELPGKGRVDLHRRLGLRRVLEALVEKRLDHPGAALDPHELFVVGWPGVQVHPEAAMNRVYLTVWKLRDSGLSEVLLNQTDGYLLDPEVPVIRVSE